MHSIGTKARFVVDRPDMPDNHGLKALVETASAIAEEAGRLLLDGYRTRPEAAEKGRADLVTGYDIESERLIRRRLEQACPDIPVMAEEHGGTIGAGLTWYCDPLDGTTNYVHGHPFWAVSVGLLNGDAPLAGVVLAPALGVQWRGIVGAGAFRNGMPCRVSEARALQDALVATGFPPDRSRAPDNNLDAFCRVIKRARGVRRCGSAAIDCCLVADGTVDGYWERALHAWDLAAGCSIAVAAGARLTALDGERADLAIGHLVLASPAVHEPLRQLVLG